MEEQPCLYRGDMQVRFLSIPFSQTHRETSNEMAKAARNSKDKEMAAYLKRMGVQRTTGQCPSCHGTIGNGKVHTVPECLRVIATRKGYKGRMLVSR